MSAYMTSMLQNLLANVIRLQNIYNNIEVAVKQDDIYSVWYYYGKILNIILSFDPIEELVNDPLMAPHP